jgi:hypothetical protein
MGYATTKQQQLRCGLDGLFIAVFNLSNNSKKERERSRKQQEMMMMIIIQRNRTTLRQRNNKLVNKCFHNVRQ